MGWTVLDRWAEHQQPDRAPTCASASPCEAASCGGAGEGAVVPCAAGTGRPRGSLLQLPGGGGAVRESNPGLTSGATRALRTHNHTVEKASKR